MALFLTGWESRHKRIGAIDNIPSPDREPSKDDYDWPVAPLSIDDADEQFTRLQRSHAEARDTYSLLVHERHEAAEHISMLKQEQARLPAAVFAEKMRVLLRHYETLESDVFEAQDALTTAQRVKMTARSKSVAVFKRSSHPSVLYGRAPCVLHVQ